MIDQIERISKDKKLYKYVFLIGYYCGILVAVLTFNQAFHRMDIVSKIMFLLSPFVIYYTLMLFGKYIIWSEESEWYKNLWAGITVVILALLLVLFLATLVSFIFGVSIPFIGLVK